MSKRLYLVRGLPGAGKSTLGQTLATGLGVALVEADQFFQKSEGYVWCPELVYLAHRWCQKTVHSHMADGESVVVANTFTTEKELKPYLELAAEFGYAVTTLIVEGRHGNPSIHNVPDEAITRMKHRFSIKL